MTMTPRELHLRIGRVVVDAPPGVDRHAFAAALARALPAVLQSRLGGAAGGANGGRNEVADEDANEPRSAVERTAAAIGQQVAARVQTPVARAARRP